MKATVNARATGIGVVFVAALLLAAAWALAGLAKPAPPPLAAAQTQIASCSRTVGPIAESATFTPLDEMQSHLVDLPINPSGAKAAGSTGSVVGTGILDTLPLQVAIAGERGSVIRYFDVRPVDDKVTQPEFMARGGVEYDQFPMGAGEQSFASQILESLGDRVVAVPLGSTTAALTWADPVSNGVRTHNLYWSDGKTNYAVIADRSASDLVAIGRSIVCQ